MSNKTTEITLDRTVTVNEKTYFAGVAIVTEKEREDIENHLQDPEKIELEAAQLEVKENKKTDKK